MEGDFGKDEGFVVMAPGCGEDMVDRRNQVRLGAPVMSQTIAVLNLPGGAEVRKEIGAAETVDRLLGIANEKEDAALAEDGLKDGILNRVGVLKFVDEGGAIAPTQGLGQRFSTGFLQGRPDPEQEVVVGLDILLFFLEGQLPSQDAEYLRFEIKKLVVHFCRQGLGNIP